MTPRQWMQAIREELEEQLKEKTGWGRLEVMQAFDRACASAALRFVEPQ